MGDLNGNTMEVEAHQEKDIDTDTEIEEVIENAGDSFQISKIIFNNLGRKDDVEMVREIEFVNSLKIGRSNVSQNTAEDSQRGLFDSRVLSRSHAAISFRKGKFYIQDLNSSNGTYVNDCNLEPMKEELIYSEDILQFGTRVGIHEPVKVRVELYSPNSEKYEARVYDCESLGTISERDILELNRTLEEAGTSVTAIEAKLHALGDIIDDFKDLHDRNKIEKEFLEKIKNIEETLDSLKALEKSKLDNREEINMSIRKILVAVIQELIVDQTLDDGQQKTFLQLMIKKLKSCPDDSVDEYNVVITNSPMTTLKASSSPERVLSPIVFYQDDEIEGMEQSEMSTDDVQIRFENCGLDVPKGILKHPNSPRTSAKLIRINVIPEIREIENCLEDENWKVTSNCLKNVICDSPDEEEDKVVEEKTKITNNSPRKRSFVKKKEEVNLFDPQELREKLIKVSCEEEDKKEGENEDTSDQVPLEEKIDEIKSQIDQNKNEMDEQFEKTQNGIREVQNQVGQFSGIVNKIVNQFIFSIQGFFLCFIFGIISLGIGLKKHPQILEFW